MLILLPLGVFALIYLHALAARPATNGIDRDVRGPLVVAVIGWGSLLVILCEGLGALGLLNRVALASAWLAVGMLLLAVGLRTGALGRAVRELRAVRFTLPGWEAGLLAGAAVIVLILLPVALIAPPNNVDSLLYHMSRVMHWAQNGSLRHYATGYHHQLIMPPFAELAILDSRLLVGSDRLANLVQWSSLVGSLVVVSAIARLLGARPVHQILAVVFAATLPLGVLQATSTQNDMVVALWTVCTAYLVFLGLKRPLLRSERVALGLSFGLGLLTKVTFTVYALPLAGLHAIGNLRSLGWRRGLGSTALVGTLACLMNLPTWARNLDTYGGLYGPPDWMRSNSALIGFVGSLQSSPSRPTDLMIGILQWPIQRVAQGAALNLLTPSFALNQILWGVLDRFPSIFDGVVSHSLERAAWSHEDTAGNPTHLAVLVITLGALGYGYRSWRHHGALLLYVLTVVSGFVLLVMVLSEGVSIFGIRFQLPFFVLASPMVGLILAQPKNPAWHRGAGILLLLSALPYLLFNNTRPIIGHPPWPTRVDSVFTATAVDLLFAPNPHALTAYLEVRDSVLGSGCDQVGLRLDSGDLEYQIWWLLDAPQSGVRLESVYTYPSLEHLLDSTFQPCAVICTICSDSTELGRLRLTIDRGPVRLYTLPTSGGAP